MYLQSDSCVLEVVPVDVSSVILQSIDGTQAELNISGGENLRPALLNPDLCANLVLKVSLSHNITL